MQALFLYVYQKNKPCNTMHGLVNKGMGEIFHDQTKGFKFVCDSLHDSNILVYSMHFNYFVQYFT